MRGIGETPIMPLGVSYLDDFSREENTPFYLGWLHFYSPLSMLTFMILMSVFAHIFVCVTVFNLISCEIWAELHYKALNTLFCVSVFTSLHPYSWNPRTNVWVYAWLLPHQNLCGHWIRGFRYGSMFIICFKYIS